MASTPGKDTIYIDVDDDITGIIEKVRASEEKIVALVLPKRATVLQSIVNMKLLKRSAGGHKKKVVLITSEANLLPLAGAVGLYVAKTLQSAPQVPDPPTTPSDLLETVSESGEVEDVPVDKSAAIGELAGLPADEAEETIEVDDEPDEAAVAGAAGKKAKNKKLKVPNFDSFRKKLFLGIGGLVVLLLLWIFAYKILPKAHITITTDSSSVNTSLDFTADTGAKAVDTAQNILPATQKTFTKTDSEKVTTTGQKDEGTKATGTMTVYYCPSNNNTDTTLPANTAFSSNGFVFRTNKDVTVPASNFTGGGVCKKDQSANVTVTSDQAGDKYNLGARDYSSSASDISGHGSAMTGGTSKIVKTVAQADVDAGKQKILDRNNDAAKAELTKQMKADKLFVITDTFNVGTPAVTSTPNVGDEASEVSVNLTISYTMLSVKNDELKKLVDAEVKKHIDQGKQTILSEGLDKAQVSVTNKVSDTNVKVNLQTNAEAGPQLDAAAIKKAIAGKKRGDTQSIIEARPGIKEVKIDYSPFWVGATPSRQSRITVVFLQPNGQPSNQ